MIQVSLEMDDNPTYGIDLEKEIMDTMAKEIAQEIDGELMADMLVACGWTKIKNQYYYNNLHAENIKSWLKEHCKGNYKRLGSNWVFEDQGDAVNFTLRWT